MEIVNPGGPNTLRYMKRKGYESRSCQFVCDHLLLFTNVVSRWYVSAHVLSLQSGIFEESQLFEEFQRGQYQGILLRDPVYTFMLTPVCIPRTAAERCSNQANSSMSGVMERAFGICKKIFPYVAKGTHLRCIVSKFQWRFLINIEETFSDMRTFSAFSPSNLIIAFISV